MKTLLFIMSFVSVSAFAGNVQFPSELDPLVTINGKDVSMLITGIMKGDPDDPAHNANHYTPKYVKGEYINLPNNLYAGGITQLSDYNDIKCKVLELLNIEKIIEQNPESIECNKNYYTKLASSTCYKDAQFSDYFSLSGGGTTFATKYNCEGKVEITPIYAPLIGGGDYSGIKSYADNDSKKFYLMSYAMTLHRHLRKVKSNTKNTVGEYSMASAFQCSGNLKRLSNSNYEKPPGSSCQESTNSCSRHEDCCSMNCVQDDPEAPGVCMKELSCYRLLNQGETCKLLDNGQFNPYCDNKMMRHIFDPSNNPKPLSTEKLVQCIETDYNSSEVGECTQNGDTPTPNKLCCSDRTDASGKCIEKFTCDICYRGGETLPSGEKCCPGYYKSQSGKCIQDFPPLYRETNNTNSKSLLEKIFSLIIPSAYAQDTQESALTDDERKAFADRRKKCIEDHSGDEEAKQDCLAKVSADESALITERLNQPGEAGSISRAEYIKKFNRAIAINKKGSDFNSCEFHSFNDNWNSSSDTYRNAQLVVMGFEYLYSGAGTIDYWLDSSGKSFFERAQAISKKLKENRTALLAFHKKIDEDMTKECQNFFSGVQGSSGEKSTTSVSQDGGTTTQVFDTEKEANHANVDRGASGIKHMELLVRFTKLREEASLLNFSQNADLEGELQQISDDVEGTQWEQSWTKSTDIFEFRLRKPRGFWRFIGNLVGYIVTITTDIATAPFRLIGGAISGNGFKLWAFTEVLYDRIHDNRPETYDYYGKEIEDTMYGSLYRELEDRGLTGWEANGSLFTRKKRFRRIYHGPYFKSNSPQSLMSQGAGSSNNICDINASSRMCFKNIYSFAYVEGDDINDNPHDPEERFLLDVKYPEFIRDADFGGDAGILEKINTSYIAGINKLKSNNPGGTRSIKWQNKNLDLGKKEYSVQFLPKAGQWIPKVFDKSMILKVQNGAKKYAQCFDLQECGSSQEGMGFGHLLADETDAKEFGDYFYQHHFTWPSMASAGGMGYPTLALSSYIQSVLYYMKTIGSLAGTNAREYGNLGDKYQNYLTDLEGEYDNGEGGYQGSGSSNVEYTTEFRTQFALLNFDTGEGADQFVGQGGVPKIPEGFNSSETTVFTAGINKALRAKKQKEKADHYEKTVGNTKRAKLKKKAQGEFLNTFGRPIDKMSAALRKGLDTAPKSASDTKEEKKESTSTVAAYQPPVLPSYNSNYNNSGYSSGSSNSNSGNATNTGLSEAAKNKMLLDSADKTSRDLKRDDGDSLFKIVTKAYFRNLDLILERTTSAKASIQRKKVLEFKKKEDEISNDKKSELKKLLNE